MRISCSSRVAAVQWIGEWKTGHEEADGRFVQSDSSSEQRESENAGIASAGPNQGGEREKVRELIREGSAKRPSIMKCTIKYIGNPNLASGVNEREGQALCAADEWTKRLREIQSLFFLQNRHTEDIRGNERERTSRAIIGACIDEHRLACRFFFLSLPPVVGCLSPQSRRRMAEDGVLSGV